jgi:hypothetical protein
MNELSRHKAVHNAVKSEAGTKRLVYWAAGLSMGTVIAHGIDAPDHLREWWGYGTFFIIVAAFQFFYGFSLFLQPWRYDENGGVRADAVVAGRPYFIMGLSLIGASLFMYIISRTTGLPFLGQAAAAEPVTFLSLVPAVEAVPLAYCLVRLLMATYAPR